MHHNHEDFYYVIKLSLNFEFCPPLEQTKTFLSILGNHTSDRDKVYRITDRPTNRLVTLLARKSLSLHPGTSQPWKAQI